MNPRRMQGGTAQLRNVPMRPRAWRGLLETPDAVTAEGDEGILALVPNGGELRLFWAFDSVEAMRTSFAGLFAELHPRVTAAGVDYVALDLVEVPDRDWLEPVLADVDFEFFAEWMELTQPDLDPHAVPEFPDGVAMRRAKRADHARVREIWSEAYGDYADGAHAIEDGIATASWLGVLERDGEVVAFAANGPVADGEGRVRTAAVAPEWQGNGYGRLVLAAAAYQLTTQDARQATVLARPDVPQALRTCTAVGFRPGRTGVEYRRTTDEDAIRERREARRKAGVKARFGGWR